MRQSPKKTTRHRSAAGTGEKRWRGFLIPAFLCLLFLLSGCSAAEDLILRTAVPAEDYQEYADLRDSGQLDPDGHYIAPDLAEPDDAPQPDESGIHITFAKNEYIDISYYLDPDLKQTAPESGCTLKPGDCLYYDPEGITYDHPYALSYEFDRFAVFEYTEDGERGKELSWDKESGGPDVVLKIPENYKGSELSIMPLGRYEKRTLEFSDYYIDSADRQQELDGTWLVNDEQITEASMLVSPTESLSVDYRYDQEKYAFVSSTPASFYHDKGLVRFEVADALDSVERYCVELRSLEGTFLFDPSQFPASHGSVEYQYQGRVLTEAIYIPDGEVISYTATPEKSYRHPRGSGQVIVNASDPDKTRADLKEAAHFIPDGQVDVILPQAVGGTIEYTVDGATLEGEKSTLPSGTVITMQFTPWNGWVCNEMDGYEYTVEGPGPKTVSVEGLDINHELFKESDNYMPTLDLVVEKSAKDVLIDLYSGDKAVKEALSYGSGDKTSSLPDWLGQNDRSVFHEKIGTYPNITLTFKEDTILAEYALKLDIRLKDTRGNESHSVRYVEKLPAKEELNLYDSQARSRSNAVYETVTVAVSKVEVVPYHTESAEHAVITAQLADVKDLYLLRDGELLEASRDVTITIAPEEGYYISGSENNAGTYTQTLKYEEWEKKFQSILDKHPAKTLWYVTLDAEDAYGDCVYQLGKEKVSGRVGVHEGQKLTLTYTVTDPDYRIVKGTVAGLIGKITRSETEQCDIPITEALDGQTITRADYISVEKQGG